MLCICIGCQNKQQMTVAAFHILQHRRKDCVISLFVLLLRGLSLTQHVCVNVIQAWRYFASIVRAGERKPTFQFALRLSMFLSWKSLLTFRYRVENPSAVLPVFHHVVTKLKKKTHQNVRLIRTRYPLFHARFPSEYQNWRSWTGSMQCASFEVRWFRINLGEGQALPSRC